MINKILPKINKGCLFFLLPKISMISVIWSIERKIIYGINISLPIFCQNFTQYLLKKYFPGFFFFWGGGGKCPLTLPPTPIDL